jgi:hypothetical protein
VPEALDRIRLAGLPFLFYLGGDRRRGCVLYVRYDGLIDPRAEGVEPTVIPQISPPRTERCEADRGKPAHL